MDDRTAHRILEVTPGSGFEDLKQAYRKLSKRYHPDKHSDDNQEWAVDNFRRVKEAYDFLVKSLEEREARRSEEQSQSLRRLLLSPEGTCRESVLIELASEVCFDVGAWGKSLPFYSRVSFKFGANQKNIHWPVYKSEDFENDGRLERKYPLGPIEMEEPPPSITILTKIDTEGRVKISLLGESKFLDFQWRLP